ncbi:MAG: DUF4388 domain-containing protein [Planctomycetota bacterium]|jgi:hypothetical protein
MRDVAFLLWFPSRPVELKRDRTYCLGRGSASDVFVNDSQASRQHADIVATDDGFRLVDLGSANGTYVNGEQVTEAMLAHGDEIQIGSHVLEFRLEDAEEVIEDFRRQARAVQEGQTVVGPVPGSGGLSGAIDDVGLAEVVQMLEAGRKSGRLLVTAVGLSAAIYFKDGRIIAAEFQPNTAEPKADHEAVCEIFALKDGVFEFLPEEVTIEPRMNESTQALLLETMRRLDERERADPGFNASETQVC